MTHVTERTVGVVASEVDRSRTVIAEHVKDVERAEASLRSEKHNLAIARERGRKLGLELAKMLDLKELQ